MVGPSAGLDDFAVRGTPEGFHAVEGFDELLAILKGHTEQAGGEAVGCAGVGGEDAHAVEITGGLAGEARPPFYADSTWIPPLRAVFLFYHSW